MTKRIILFVVVAPLLLMGATCVDEVSMVCALEQNAHAAYVAFVAKARPATAVAREAAFYARVQNLCAAGATIAQINAASSQAAAARAQ